MTTRNHSRGAILERALRARDQAADHGGEEGVTGVRTGLVGDLVAVEGLGFGAGREAEGGGGGEHVAAFLGDEFFAGEGGEFVAVG